MRLLRGGRVPVVSYRLLSIYARSLVLYVPDNRSYVYLSSLAQTFTKVHLAYFL